MRTVIFLCMAAVLLSGCRPKGDHKEAVKYLCEYQQQLVVLNGGVQSFKDICMRGAYRISNSPDQKAAAATSLDSMIAAADAYATIVDGSIGRLQKIKPITDTTHLMMRSSAELTELSVFCRNDFKDYCLHAKDSIDPKVNWMQSFMPVFQRVASTGTRLADYQQAFGNAAQLDNQDYTALVRCQGK